MTHAELNRLIHAATALPPEQMEALRNELDRKLATLAAAVPPTDKAEPAADPILGCMRDHAELMDEIVADAYRHRQEDVWRELEI